MSGSRECEYCRNRFPSGLNVCPHCGRPSLFPNVFAAEEDEEREELENRYQSAQAEGVSRGVADALKAFEAALANSSAVIARHSNEVQRLATSDLELYATYYQLTRGDIRVPEGSQWDILRTVADSALFPNYKEDIRFAALSLEGAGLFNYGDCLIVLREDMIAHRASVFEQNSVVFMKNHHIQSWDLHKLPRGYRATWAERGKLCIAKLHRDIDAGTGADKYSSLLLREGSTTEDDAFVEVHIYGPMTARTFECVIISRRLKSEERIIILDALRERLSALGVGID